LPIKNHYEFFSCRGSARPRLLRAGRPVVVLRRF
jgi:hypothetical protein